MNKLRSTGFDLHEMSDIIDENDIDFQDFIPTLSKSYMSNLFATKVSKHVYKQHKILIFIFLALAVVNVWSCAQLQTSNRNENMLKDSNGLQKALNWKQYELWKDEQIKPVQFNFGIEPYI